MNGLAAKDIDEAPVSVVLPCFNTETTIATAIASVQSQYESNVDLDIICINDGSTDSTHSLLSAFAAKGVITLIEHSTSRGASAARNSGLQVTRRKYIQFLDADDILLPGKLQRQVNLLMDSGADFIAGAYEAKRMDGSCSTQYPEEDHWAGLISSKLGRTSSNLFRTKTLHEVGGWAEEQKSSQEYELMFRLSMRGELYDGNVAFDSMIGARIISTEGSISNRDLEGNAIQFIQLRQKMIDYLHREKLLTDYHKSCYETMYQRSLADLSEETKARLALADNIS